MFSEVLVVFTDLSLWFDIGCFDISTFFCHFVLQIDYNWGFGVMVRYSALYHKAFWLEFSLKLSIFVAIYQKSGKNRKKCPGVVRSTKCIFFVKNGVRWLKWEKKLPFSCSYWFTFFSFLFFSTPSHLCASPILTNMDSPHPCSLV